jgi:hypothetical protein
MSWIRQRGRRGATLIEGITAATCLSLMILGLATLTRNASYAWSFGSSKMMADNNASLALQQLAQEVRKGIRAYVDGTGTQLYVVFPQVNSQGDYVRNKEGASVRYFLYSGTLYKADGTVLTVLGKKITNFSFSVNGTQVGLTLSAKQQNGTQSGTTTLSTQVTMRNPSY